jgi:hypothetical protein
MRRKQQAGGKAVETSVGFAVNEKGAGVAYAAVHDGTTTTLERVAFDVKSSRSNGRRAAAYAALVAITKRLLKGGYESVRFAIEDEALVADLSERRSVPQALALPYVALRCGLNRFASAEVVHAPSAETGDLSARALAEASLRVAA